MNHPLEIETGELPPAPSSGDAASPRTWSGIGLPEPLFDVGLA